MSRDESEISASESVGNINDVIVAEQEETLALDSLECEQDFTVESLSVTMTENMAKIIDRLTALEDLFQTKIMRIEHEAKIADQMHRELQKHKEDLYFQLVRPILLDMIEIRDSILRMAEIHLHKSDQTAGIPVKTFATYASDVQEILEKNNIEIFKSEVGTDFIPLRQRIIKKTATAKQELHGQVAESLSDGYCYHGQIIAAEKVAIYFYEQPQTEAVENQREEEEDG